jgi:hypothetical protein
MIGESAGGESMKVHAASGSVVAVMLSLVSGACGAGETESRGGLDVGLKVTDQATAADAGLPAYPGSKPYKDADQSSSGANIGVSTPLFGLKVVAMNLETSDKPERVATFYRKALSKYGTVLECSDAANEKEESEPSAKTGDELACDADDPGTNSVVYKVGTEANQRIVAIKPHGSGTRFSVVHLDKRGKAGK